MLDVDRLAEVVLTGTKALLAKELAPLREQNSALLAANDALTKRLAEVEAREPINGKDADLDEVRALISAAVNAIPQPAEPAPLPDFEEMARSAAKEAADAVIKAIPQPEVVDVSALVDEAVQKSLASLPQPAEPAPLPDVAAMVDEAVTARLKSLPAPEMPEFAKPEAVEAVRKDVERIGLRLDEIRLPEIVHGKDAPTIAGVRQNDDGELILKMSDGNTFNAGHVRGADGLGFDDLTVEHDGERSFTLHFSQGARVKSYPISFDVPLDRGVWRERSYQKGDGVTWAGSWWIAQGKTDSKPGTSSDWRLAVKAGRNGKDVVSLPREDKPFRLEDRNAD